MTPCGRHWNLWGDYGVNEDDVFVGNFNIYSLASHDTIAIFTVDLDWAIW